MNSFQSLKLVLLLPELTNDIIEKLKKEDRSDLLNQVQELKIISLCECGDPNCGSFYTIEPSKTENEQLNHEGFRTPLGLIEVFDGEIGFIEIMPSEIGKEIRTKISKALIREER
ncbi:hypothetical protein [Paenibacillus xylanexedens]|uniref:hypothetical protein n=1 Tax=Paenibacillus xylanexedens TaxID=528191 RepID=UPI0011A769AF|nr:hypothetical protein [Paenibacillus xylanexedens]